MSSHADDEDDKNEDPRNLKRSALERLVLKYRAKRLSERDPAEVKKDGDAAEEEREKLSDLHEEKKGKAPSPPVEKDDLPEELEDVLEDEDEDEEKTPKKKQKA